jgi:hypothetical protein
MLPLRIPLALLPLSLTLAAPSLNSYDEAFPQPRRSKDPTFKDAHAVQFLDLPALQASNDDYRLAPQVLGTCVVICIMIPHPTTDKLSRVSHMDNYVQYACAPSCNKDLDDKSQPIKGELKYSEPEGDSYKLLPEEYPANSVVVTFE